MTTELQTGTEISFRTLPTIEQSQLSAYAEASGDPNRIHLDESVAKARGLPGVIAHGMLSAAFLADRALCALLESERYRGFRPQNFQSRFKAMVFLGDTVSIGGKVKEATDDRIVFDLQVKKQTGEVVTSGCVEFLK